MPTRQELADAAARGSDALAPFAALGRGEKYRHRQALYQPGTLVAVPLIPRIESPGVEPPGVESRINEGDYGLVMIRGCNWLGDIMLFNFNVIYNGVPSLAEAQEVATPQNLWYWEDTGDQLILTGYWEPLGNVDPWVETEWRQPIQYAPYAQPEPYARILEYQPRRRRQEVKVPVTPEIIANPGWSFGPSGCVAAVAWLSVVLVDPNRIPAGR